MLSILTQKDAKVLKREQVVPILYSQWTSSAQNQVRVLQAISRAAGVDVASAYHGKLLHVRRRIGFELHVIVSCMNGVHLYERYRAC